MADKTRNRTAQNTTKSRSLDVFQVRIGDFRPAIVGDTRSLAFHVFHQSIEIITGGGDADNAYGGAVPQLCSIQLGDRNIKAGAQAVLEAADHLATVFEGMRSFDAELEGEESDQFPSRWLLVIGH
jgi:hypothetical protein